MTKTTSVITPLALIAAFTLFSTPSFAQQRERGRRNSSGQESSGRAEGRERGQPRAAAPAPAPQAQAPAPQPQAQAQPQQRQEQQQQRARAPRAEGNRDEGQRSSGQRAVPRREGNAPRYDRNDSNGRNNRNDSNRRYDRGSNGRSYSPRYVPRYYAPRYGIGVRSYRRPYVYRPRLSIGLGIFMGYPVPYAYSYPYPINVYGYSAPRGPVVVGPGSQYYGGIALEITPYDADVYVDGSYAGRVEDFDGSSQPLTLAAGTHRIEIQADGYAPLVVDVGVQAGQIIPYRGDLQPY